MELMEVTTIKYRLKPAGVWHCSICQKNVSRITPLSDFLHIITDNINSKTSPTFTTTCVQGMECQVDRDRAL